MFKNIRTWKQFLVLIFIRPIFPPLQWIVVVLKISRPESVEGTFERQPFLLGYLKDDVSVDHAHSHLRSVGFYPNRIAYIDPGQSHSLRRLCDDCPDRQYHIRIFSDGEVRGHYEYTPEDKPFKHHGRALFEERTHMFDEWVRDIIHFVNER